MDVVSQPRALCSTEGRARVIHTHAPAAASFSWPAWLQTAPIATVSVCDLVRKPQRLVVVAPHPDDEVLACGGLLHSHAALGGDCLVVAVTDGEASHAQVPGHDGAALAARRCSESAAGLHRLGVSAQAVRRLSLHDGGLQHQVDTLVRRLEPLLRPGDVVLTTWRRDGHPDHEACARACLGACTRTRATLLEAPVWMWHWATPADLQVPWEHLVKLALTPAAVRAKRHALGAHLSQLTPRSVALPAVLDAALVARASWNAEYIFRMP